MQKQLKTGRKVEVDRQKQENNVTYYLVDGYVWMNENQFIDYEQPKKISHTNRTRKQSKSDEIVQSDDTDESRD